VREAGNSAAMRGDLRLILVYLLSFVHTGIYWVNHHYLIDDVDEISHALLWSNLGFLFTLSLIPFATNWVGTRGISPFAVALYSVCCALPAVAWLVLSSVICRGTGKPLGGSPAKQIVSTTLYVGAIPIAYISTTAALAMIVIVAILWLLPPRLIVEKSGNPAAPPPSSIQSR